MKTKRIAIALIVNDENKLLMGKRNDNKKWTVPAGRINKRECPFAGMARELKEETGLDAKEMKMITAVLQDGMLLYLFEIKIDKNQTIDTSNDPDEECNDWSYEDPSDHVDELHVPPEKNLIFKYWKNEGGV